MNQGSDMSGQNGGPPEGERLRMLDFVAVVLRRWKTVIVCAAATVLLIVGVSRLLPDTYAAQTTLVPAPTQGDGGMQRMAANLPPALAARMGGGGPSNQKVVGTILKSQTLRDTLAHRLAADRTAGVTEAEVYRILAKGTQIRQSPADGSITIEVHARKPAAAARVAGEFADLVNQIATGLSLDAAQKKRAVLERQLAAARERLTLSEGRLVAFQQRRGAADVPEQARQTMTTAASVEQTIIQKEVEVQALRSRVTAENPQLRRAQAELQALRQQRSRLLGGGGGDVFLSPRDVPSLRAEGTRLAREFATDEQVYLSLSAQLASVQVDMNDNLALVSVLDAPTVPAGPMGSLPRLLVTAMLLGLVVGVVAAFVREYASHVRKDDVWNAAVDDFKRDVSGLVPGRRRAASTPG